MESGEKIKAIRKALNLTLVDFSTRLNVSKSLISMIENGINALTARLQNDIIRVYNVSTVWWDTGQGDMFTTSPTVVTDVKNDEHLIAAIIAELPKLTRPHLKAVLSSVIGLSKD